MTILIILFMSTFYNLLSQCSSKKTSVINSNWMAKSQSSGWEIFAAWWWWSIFYSSYWVFSACLVKQRCCLLIWTISTDTFEFGLGWCCWMGIVVLYSYKRVTLLVKNVQTFINSKKGQKKENFCTILAIRGLGWFGGLMLFIYYLSLTYIILLSYSKFFWKWNCPTFEDNKHSKIIYEKYSNDEKCLFIVLAKAR